ncbi:SIS domain-containing protein [Candidatus Marinimicrobia bacterium]|nr:SIS domain-containing protein [Candidatus Neomarinimicrobiota bacterium]
MINKIISQAIFKHRDVLKLIDEELIKSSYELMKYALKNGSTIFWCGNGGSASQANHLSAELVGGMYQKKIKPFKSICLNVDTSFITAWSNDNSFDNIFLRQIESLGKAGDILIGLSTSGNSPNIIKAAEFAQSNGLQVISLTGNDGGILNKFSDININIPTSSTQRIQEMHILIGHILCDLVEKNCRK